MMIAQRRGEIIHRTIKLEFFMDGIVKGYLSGGDKSKVQQIHLTVIQKKPFGFKKDRVLEALQGMLVAQPIFDQITEDLQFVHDIRNKAAHFDWALVSENEIYLKPDSGEKLLDMTDERLFQFSIGQERIERFKQACSRLQHSLGTIFWQHYNPFPDSLNSKMDKR